MDFGALSDDFFVTVSQFIKTTYRDEYHVVDPTSKALSQERKVILITGASQGLGRQGFAPAFAIANSKAIVLVARNESEVEAAGQEIRNLNLKVQVLTQALDVRNQDSVKALYAKIKENFGTADVLVNNTGSGKPALAIKDVDPEDFWYDFEVNVKGTLLMTQSFLQLIGDSKLATIINRFVAVENSNITAMSLHPGTVLTGITKPQFVKFSKDTFALAGGVAVWLATEQAKFMNGRYMCANWSVAELIDRKDEIISKRLLLEELQGTFGKAQFES